MLSQINLISGQPSCHTVALIFYQILNTRLVYIIIILIAIHFFISFLFLILIYHIEGLISIPIKRISENRRVINLHVFPIRTIQKELDEPAPFISVPFLWCRFTRYFRFPLIGWESQRYFNVSLVYWWKLTAIRNQLDFLFVLYTIMRK